MASTVGKENIDFIRPVQAVAGDVLVLTKPLGTQVAVNIFEWSHKGTWTRTKDVITLEQGIEAYETACESMSRLNKNAAMLLHKVRIQII